MRLIGWNGDVERLSLWHRQRGRQGHPRLAHVQNHPAVASTERDIRQQRGCHSRISAPLGSWFVRREVRLIGRHGPEAALALRVMLQNPSTETSLLTFEISPGGSTKLGLTLWSHYGRRIGSRRQTVSRFYCGTMPPGGLRVNCYSALTVMHAARNFLRHPHKKSKKM